MSRSVRAALFDVDGTLVDTNYLHAVTWWEAFTQAGYQPAMADIHRAIGMGSDQMLDKLLPAGRDKDADADARGAQHPVRHVLVPAAAAARCRGPAAGV
jgi:beta-phosphoglucomutase-like phosphatase (HAD superfamily)